MTLSSTHLIECVRELVSSGATIDERIDALFLQGRLPSADAQMKWLGLAAAAPAPFRDVQVHIPTIGGDLDEADHFDAEREVTITIQKPIVDNCALFIFQSAVPRYLQQQTVRPRLAIVDFDPKQVFRARGLEVFPWVLDQPIVPLESQIYPVDPTRYVRDFVPDREVATDLNPWMLLSEPAATSTVYQAWEAIAARRLLGGLVSRVWLEEGKVWFQAAATPPIYRIDANDPILPSARAHLTEAVNWVFLSGSDVEARHLLFSCEFARADRPQQDFNIILAQALEAAKASYEAHVQSSSRETLKALADLRKTVIEETQKIVQRAQDLAAMLWRDLAVSAAPFVLRSVGDMNKVAGPVASSTFYFAAATIIGLSFVLQWRMNSAFFRIQTSSRRSWAQSLYNYISLREREEIAETPIAQALKSYRETRNVLGVVYLILVVILICSGIQTYRGSMTSIPQPAAGAVLDQEHNLQPARGDTSGKAPSAQPESGVKSAQEKGPEASLPPQ